MSLTVKEVCDKLEKIQKPTPKTCSFDKKDGQKDDRWWDKEGIGENKENMSKQQYHIIGYFICQYYNGSGFSGKNSKECKKGCTECYKKKDYVVENPKNDVTAKVLYGRMRRPEMYMWIVEALGVLEGDQLDNCFQEIEQEWKESKSMAQVRKILKNYEINWEKIEEKLEQME